MKKILAFVVVVLVVAGTVHANVPSPVSPQGMSIIKSGDVVKLFYRGENSGKVRVSIMNEKGDKLFTETIKAGSFMRPYNFSALPEGTYTIELSDTEGKLSQSVHYSTVEPGTIAHLTRLRNEDNKYILAIPDAGQGSLKIRIFDQDDNLIYSETENVNGDFARLYNIGNVDGNHTFEIIDDGGNVSRLSKPLQK